MIHFAAGNSLERTEFGATDANELSLVDPQETLRKAVSRTIQHNFFRSRSEHPLTALGGQAEIDFLASIPDIKFRTLEVLDGPYSNKSLKRVASVNRTFDVVYLREGGEPEWQNHADKGYPLALARTLVRPDGVIICGLSDSRSSFTQALLWVHSSNSVVEYATSQLKSEEQRRALLRSLPYVDLSCIPPLSENLEDPIFVVARFGAIPDFLFAIGKMDLNLDDMEPREDVARSLRVPVRRPAIARALVEEDLADPCYRGSKELDPSSLYLNPAVVGAAAFRNFRSELDRFIVPEQGDSGDRSQSTFAAQLKLNSALKALYMKAAPEQLPRALRQELIRVELDTAQNLMRAFIRSVRHGFDLQKALLARIDLATSIVSAWHAQRDEFVEALPASKTKVGEKIFDALASSLVRAAFNPGSSIPSRAELREKIAPSVIKVERFIEIHLSPEQREQLEDARRAHKNRGRLKAVQFVRELLLDLDAGLIDKFPSEAAIVKHLGTRHSLLREYLGSGLTESEQRSLAAAKAAHGLQDAKDTLSQLAARYFARFESGASTHLPGVRELGKESGVPREQVMPHLLANFPDWPSYLYASHYSRADSREKKQRLGAELRSAIADDQAGLEGALPTMTELRLKYHVSGNSIGPWIREVLSPTELSYYRTRCAEIANLRRSKPHAKITAPD